MMRLQAAGCGLQEFDSSGRIAFVVQGTHERLETAHELVVPGLERGCWFRFEHREPTAYAEQIANLRGRAERDRHEVRVITSRSPRRALD